MADGSVIIDTKMDTSGVEAGAKDISSSLNRIVSLLETMSRGIDNIFSQMSSGANSAAQSTSNLRKEIEETTKAQDKWQPQDMSTVPIHRSSEDVDYSYEGPLHEPVQLDSRVMEDYAKKAEEAKQIMDEMSGSTQEAETHTNELKQAIDDTVASLKEMEKNGFYFGDAEYDTAYQKLVGLTAEAKEYKKNLAVATVVGENNQELDEQNKKLSIAQNLVNKIKATFSGIGKNLSSGAIKNSGKSMADGFGSALKTLLKYSIGIRSLFVLMNKLRSAVVDGFKNLAQYSGSTDSSISMLTSALTRLKNSLATAFNPILQAIAPALTSLINLLSKAATYVGMFFAAFTGQKTFTKAITAQEDWAASLDKSSKNTKKASKQTKDYLSSLDEVHKATTNGTDGNDGAGGYKGPSPSEMFETVPIENRFKKLADKIKKILSEIFKPFKEAWAKEGANTIKAAKYALKSLGTLAKSVSKSIAEVWTNGTGTTMLETMLRIAQNVLTTIGNIASGLAEAWNKNSVGTAIIQNIANALQTVLSFIERIAADTATWAANLDFYPLLESISNLTATFAPILESIGNVLEWIYNNIVLPMLKWAIETGIPTLINLVADLLGFFADHQSIIEAFGAALIGAFAAVKIAGLAKSIGGSITGIIGFGKGLVSLMTGSGGILGGVKAIATAIGGGGVFAIAVGAAIAIGVLLYKNWDKIKEVAGAVWKWISEKTVSFVNGIGTKLSNLATKMSAIWGNIKSTAKEKWDSIWSTIGGVVGKIANGIVNKFTSVKDRVVEIFGGIRDTIRDILNKVIGIVNGAIGTVNSAIGGIESAFSFGPWEVPTPFGHKTIGFNASFPRVPTIPYLAKGAVIPPRSEFLAVLGDQKNGRNLEAPEGVIKEIIDDAFTRHQQSSGGGSYRFVAQMNRRTVFDEMIEEAKLRQSTSGRNPFELA
ncbi:phage tail protein [Blautia sp. MSJ-19]|uniref:phage tail protein n=1 Tax=Blautia sp. MSJ-19 TaxID=2841517 RepID=UPI001C0ECB02|nr:hypothetical protein [Blautia sp. MSJ-19]MBU5481740.1 hypothetical protein [Blautia sp. MSJ-19]